jgi:hypothetical protein
MTIRWNMQWMTRILTSSYSNLVDHGAIFSHFVIFTTPCNMYGNKLFAKAWRFLVAKTFQLHTWCTCYLICKVDKYNINPWRFEFPSHFLFIELKLLYMLYEWWSVIHEGGFGWLVCKQFCNLVLAINTNVGIQVS